MVDRRGICPTVRLPVDAASNLLAAVRGFAGEAKSRRRSVVTQAPIKKRVSYKTQLWLLAVPRVAFDSGPGELCSL